MPVSLYSSASVDSLLSAKLSDAPIDGSTYGRKDAAWEVISASGLTISTLSNGATSTLNASVPSAEQVLVFDGTDLAWHYQTVLWGSIGGTLSSQTDLQTELDNKANLSAPSFTSGISVDGTGITFSDSTTQSSAGVSNDKAIANAFAASMWYAWDGYDYARNGVVNTNYIGGSYLSAGISDGTTFAAGFPATNATLDTGSYWYVSINGTLSDLFIFSP